MKLFATRILVLFVLSMFAGCANITAPTGGKKDTTPPKLVSISPKDSLLNAKVNKIEMHFDEYITVSDASTEVQISPILAMAPTVLGLNKKVTVKIVDSLLDSNTTYRISFGKSIKDVHEGNPFRKYTYTFSTGTYFDSLKLSGSVIDAATGLPDTNGITIELYNANVKDSEVIRHKPKYITKVNNKGTFLFKGLPRRSFRLYALKDANGNLIYDGIGEMIAFNDTTVIPGDTTTAPIILRLFEEKVDTGTKKTDSTGKLTKSDSTIAKKQTDSTTVSGRRARPKGKEEALTYNLNVDTSNITHKTFDFAHKNLKIAFNRNPVINTDKVTLTCDSEGIILYPTFSIKIDSLHPLIWEIRTNWKENTVYTLKLIKGFAKDTSGNDLMPSKYSFRTMEDEDYGKIKIHLPTKYNDPQYVLRVDAEKDSVYQQKVTDTIIFLKQLKPAKYSFRIIVDKNGNGIWDTGDLLKKNQPEFVIPYFETVNLKAGWELIVDFDKKQDSDKDKRKKNTDNTK